MNSFKNSKHKMPDRYSENAQGDFYVEDGVCTSCGAPQAEAPDLIDHSKREYGHCYFKRQPETDDEIERAINAIAVSCIAGLRYGGANEKILKRLYEIGASEQCDHEPGGNYKLLVWNRLTFLFTGSTKSLAELMISQIVGGNIHLHKHVINLKINNDSYFEFVYRWSIGLPGNAFKCYYIGGNKFRIEIDVEENGNEISMRWTAIDLNDSLRLDNRVSEILWFDKDNNAYKETELQ